MKVEVFIDGDWLHRASGANQFAVDFKRLREFYLPGVNTVSLSYFQIEAIKEGGTSSIRKLLDWLDCNGFRVKSIPVDLTVQTAIRDTRSEVMVWMGIEIFNAAIRRADQIVVWTSDRSMIRPIKAAQDNGANVTLVAEKRHVSGTLMRQADTFVEFGALQGLIAQTAKEPA